MNLLVHGKKSKKDQTKWGEMEGHQKDVFISHWTIFTVGSQCSSNDTFDYHRKRSMTDKIDC
jgi:hypothetical protein